MAAPLYDLLKKDAHFLWTRQHENTFRQLISVMIKATNLCIFDPHKPLFLTCDGSVTGIGALLTHDKNQTESIQRTYGKLLPAERHYSNIEREGLAIIYGINKFRNYLSGREFTIVSDHAPLKHILDNSGKCVRRLQRWQIVLRAHSFKVETCSGQSMHLPDTLSRLPCKEEFQVSVVDKHFTQEQEVIPLYNIIKQVSYQDADLNKLKRFVVNGWPARLPEKLRIYSADTAQYSIHDGCIYKGFRLVVPHILRTRVLELVHEGYVGIERMR